MKEDINYIMEKIRAQGFFALEYLNDKNMPGDLFFDYKQARIYTDNEHIVITPDTTNEELQAKLDEVISDAL